MTTHISDGDREAVDCPLCAAYLAREPGRPGDDATNAAECQPPTEET